MAANQVRDPLSRSRVLSAAMAIADVDGLSAVTMRRVASDLGVEAMSLYHHVTSKERLLDGLAEALVVEIAEAVEGMLARIGDEQQRTKAALESARDFAAVASHELRTPLTAMRTNLEVLSTLELRDDQRQEVIAFTQATGPQGGAGALIVLLAGRVRRASVS